MWFDKSYRRHLCDMPFWPYECHCEHCKKRFADEVGGLEEELLCDGKNHTVTVVFDAGVCAVYFVTDGVFCDGGEKRQFGFVRFDRNVSFEMGFDKQTENKLLNLRLCEGIHLYD